MRDFFLKKYHLLTFAPDSFGRFMMWTNAILSLVFAMAAGLQTDFFRGVICLALYWVFYTQAIIIRGSAWEPHTPEG